jgi:hypothetical protein
MKKSHIESLNNIFLDIDYEKEIVHVNLNKPFISHLYYQHFMNSKDFPDWNPNWSFEFLGKVLKFCSIIQIKRFLKRYPDFLGYII